MATSYVISHSFYECFALNRIINETKIMPVTLPCKPRHSAILHVAFSLAASSGLLDTKGEGGQERPSLYAFSIIKLWGQCSHFSFADSPKTPVAAVPSASLAKQKMYSSHSGQGLLVRPATRAVRAGIWLPGIGCVQPSSTAQPGLCLPGEV